MTATQMEMDFSPRRQRRERKPGDRQHFRTTTLTVSRREFECVSMAVNSTPVVVNYVNDIISSCRGEESDSVHHTIRRTDLLLGQWRGDYRKVNVRYTPGVVVACEMCSEPEGDLDACSGTIMVRKISQ